MCENRVSISIHSFTDSERLIGTQPSSAIQLIVSHISNKMIRYILHIALPHICFALDCSRVAFIGAFNLKLHHDVIRQFTHQSHLQNRLIERCGFCMGSGMEGASFNICMEYFKLLNVNSFAFCNYQLNVINSFVLLPICIWFD